MMTWHEELRKQLSQVLAIQTRCLEFHLYYPCNKPGDVISATGNAEVAGSLIFAG